MKTDLYTKSVLTIVAACLLSIVFRGTPLVSTLHAQDSQQLPMPVDIVKVSGSIVAGSVPVQVEK